MEELQKIKEAAEKIELWPELEITVEKVQQAAAIFIKQKEAELEKIVSRRNNFFMPPATPFPFEPEIRIQIPRNSNMTVTEQFVQKDYVAYLEYLCILIPRTNCAYTIYIDGGIFGHFQMVHQIGTVENPMKYEPPIEINSNIRIVGYNTDTVENHCFRVIMRGKQYPDPDKNPSFWEQAW